MKIQLISDTHSTKFKIYENCEALIHCGDIFAGKNKKEDYKYGEYLVEEISKHPGKQFIFVPGNHDAFLYKREMLIIREVLNPSVCNHVQLGEYNVYCTPMHSLRGWIFGTSAKSRRAIYENVKSADIIISHCPPKGILSKGKFEFEFGCKELLKLSNRVKPKLHVYGHKHSQFGMFSTEETLYVNCAMLTQDKKVREKYVVWDDNEGLKYEDW